MTPAGTPSGKLTTGQDWGDGISFKCVQVTLELCSTGILIQWGTLWNPVRDVIWGQGQWCKDRDCLDPLPSPFKQRRIGCSFSAYFYSPLPSI